MWINFLVISDVRCYTPTHFITYPYWIASKCSLKMKCFTGKCSQAQNTTTSLACIWTSVMEHLFKIMQYFQLIPIKALQIIGYYDELEVCNALGSNYKQYKLGLVLFTLGNLHPMFRSTYRSIFLSTIVKYKLVETHSLNEILKPFVSELKELAESGVTLSNGSVHKGALVAFLGDNLASHAVGGFKQSMSFAKHFCRSCLATKQESCQHFTSEEFDKRTPENYEEMCSKMHDATGDVASRLSTEYGINERSILSDAPGFSVINGLCHDPFHDLLEGAMNYELRLLLDYAMKSKLLTLSQFNDRLKSFNYGHSEIVNKPNSLTMRHFKEESKIRYSASEMLLTSYILPFLIGDKVPEKDERYTCFLKLITILRIALSPCIADDTISYLRVLIEEHHTMFTELYPSNSFIPKLHYLVHYPNQIRSHGPLVRAWTMRHEGKLNYFKQTARKAGNFKNITFSLAKRHQLWLAYHIHSGNMFTPDLTCGPIVLSKQLDEESMEIQSLMRQCVPDAKDDQVVVILRWAKYHGLKYSNDNSYLINSVTDGEPNFTKIEKVLSLGLTNMYLLLSKCTVQFYDEHLLAHAIVHTERKYILSITDLKNPWILHSRKQFFKPQLYLTPNYFVCL